jgi:hypothetical protein
MRTTSSRMAAAALAVVALMATTACGGGETIDNVSSKDSAASFKPRRPPPPPPPPASDSTLALVSASAAGVAANGDVCAVSGDGSKVLFTSTSGNLVSGDAPFVNAIYLKDLNGNGVRRVVNASRSLACVGMTPDANTVIFVNDAPNGIVDVLGNSQTEPTLMAVNLSTGQQIRISPVLRTFAYVDSYEFAGVSDDGRRVAFIAQPTRTCVIFGSCPACLAWPPGRA